MDEKLNFQNRIKTLYRKASQNPEGIIKNKNFSIRSSHQRCSMKNGVLRNFTKFTEKHLCQSFFFNKVAGLSPVTLLGRNSGTGVFCEFYEISKNTFFIEHLWWLLLHLPIGMRIFFKFLMSMRINSLVSGYNNKGCTYLNKPAAFRCRFV